MLNAEFKLFDVNIEPSDSFSKNKTDRLVLNSCKAIFYDKTYSELDELTFADLNNNDYGFGYKEYGFGFMEHFNNPYMNFYVSCFALRTNSLGRPILLNTPRPNRKLKYMMPNNYTKVNQNGNLSFGVRFYFRNHEERDALLNCDELCIEGSVALGKKRNVYDVMCRIVKADNDWKLDEAYTYRTHPKTHIYSLIH